MQLIMVPVIYLHIFSTLRHQQDLHELSERDSILRAQVASMGDRMKELTAADEKFRTERHDFRHKMQLIAGMIEQGEFDRLRSVVLNYSSAMGETAVQRYSSSAVIDAALSTYLHRAEQHGIRVQTALAFPQELPVDEVELATVFANAIENAIHACQNLRPDQRRICDADRRRGDFRSPRRVLLFRCWSAHCCLSGTVLRNLFLYGSAEQGRYPLAARVAF
jgi:signal transduction histidine kinase